MPVDFRTQSDSIGRDSKDCPGYDASYCEGRDCVECECFEDEENLVDTSELMD